MTATHWATFKTSTVDFRSRPHLVGLTDEEVEALARGEVAQDRVDQIAFIMQNAAHSLMFAVGDPRQ